MNKKSTNKRPTVAVVIPNWNGKDVIGKCLASLEAQTYKPSEIIVVENGSTDGSAEYIAKNFPKIKLIKEPVNLGFAGGVNVGIKAATSDYIWLFNNDAVAQKDCLAKLVATAVKTKADITSAVILSANGKKIDSDGDVYTIYGFPYPRHRNLAANVLPKQDEEIFAASGGASLYKASLFKEIGYFEESFFAYYEDVDLSMRAQLQKKSLWLSHNAIVLHATSHTSNKIPGFGREMAIRNSIYIFWRDLPKGVQGKVFWRFLYANWRLSLISILKGHPYRVLRAHFTALFHTPQLLRARKEIQSTKKMSAEEFLSLISRENPFKVLKSRQ